MKTVRWLKNNVLCTEHLDSFNDTIQSFCSDLFKICNSFSYGIHSLTIDQINISKGLITIKEVTCVFQDISLIQYNNTDQLNRTIGGNSTSIYKLEIDLKEKITDGINGVDVFLCKSEEFVESSREIINELGDKIVLYYKTNKLELRTKLEVGVGFKIARMLVKNGSFFLDNIIPPCLVLKDDSIRNRLENLYLTVNKKAMSIRDIILTKGQKEDMYLQINLIQILNKLDFIIQNPAHPFKVYEILRECVSLSLICDFSSFPQIPQYNHDNIFNILDMLIVIIIAYVDEGAGAKRIDFQKDQDGNYFCKYGAIKSDKITILINPINEALIPKLKICSKSYVEEVQFKRVIGSPRTITKMSGNTMIIEVTIDEFIINNEDLYIIGAENCSQISILKD